MQGYVDSSNQRMQKSLIPLIGLITDLSLSYIKSCRSINEQFRIDSFLEWEGLRWIFLLTPHTRTQTMLNSTTCVSCLILYPFALTLIFQSSVQQYEVQYLNVLP